MPFYSDEKRRELKQGFDTAARNMRAKGISEQKIHEDMMTVIAAMVQSAGGTPEELVEELQHFGLMSSNAASVIGMTMLNNPQFRDGYNRTADMKRKVLVDQYGNNKGKSTGNNNQLWVNVLAFLVCVIIIVVFGAALYLVLRLLGVGG